MRQSRTVQASIFDFYAEHETGYRLSYVSQLLDKHDEILSLIEQDLICSSTKNTGRHGLTVESVFRCLYIKQAFQASYEYLAFLLCDSQSFRTFARLGGQLAPKKSSLQATIRRITPATLKEVHKIMTNSWIHNREIECDQLRVDSTVVESNIAPPSDSRLLEDSIRVLSRLLSKSRETTGIKIRFTDQRKSAKSLAFRIFNAKKQEKDELYPKLLKVTQTVLSQVNRAAQKVTLEANQTEKTRKWLQDIEHFKTLALQVVDQTQRRVFNGENVPSSEKIVSIFEEHTDIIVKGCRDIQYGHKLNMSSVKRGFITHASIEEGNPNDGALFLPVLDAHQNAYGVTPTSIVSDGCYASKENVKKGREQGVKHVVFNKKAGLSYSQMGVKKKTFDRLKKFRAGIEGNISELKRTFGATKAMWKGQDGFNAFVWASVICYNLTHHYRMQLE